MSFFVRFGQSFGSIKNSESSLGLLLALLIGVSGAGAAIAFRKLIFLFEYLFFDLGSESLSALGDYYVIIIPVIGGLIVGPIIYLFAREAKGHGVPEVMAAIALEGGKIRPRVVIVKALASAISIGSGGSVGREGPIVHIGSAVGSTFGQKLKLPPDLIRTLVASGAAAGISATFNAPLAGIFFAMEVILRRYESRAFGLVVVSSVVASAITQRLIGSEPAFTVPTYEIVSSWEFAFYAVLGVLSAIAAHGFVTTLYAFEDLFDRIKVIPPYLLPMVGGIGLGAIGLFYPQVLGVGYEVIGVFDKPFGSIDGALIGALSLGLMIALLLLKILATSLTLGAGGSGGVFAPSLFIGAMLGGAFGMVVNSLFPGVTAPSGAYALIGMAAVFAGGARAPVTAIIILFEMTRDYEIILPVMTAVILAVVIAQALRKESIYTLKLVRRGVDIDKADSTDVMSNVMVGAVMTTDFPTVTPTTSIVELTDLFSTTGHHGFPVIDGDGELCGVVTVTDLSKVQQTAQSFVADIFTTEVLVTYPDQSLHDALSGFGGLKLGRYPVVSRENPKQLLGVMRRHDIIKAYAQGIGAAVESATPRTSGSS